MSPSRPHWPKSQTTVNDSLRDRVKDAATEAAHSAPERMREIAEQAAQHTPDKVKEIATQAALNAQELASQAAQTAPEKYRELRKAAAELDVKWARSPWARWIRENFMQFVLKPAMNYYASRRATGSEELLDLTDPVILVANHSSHMDTPVILSALPRKFRKRTAVAAAADYFYRTRITAWLASLAFNTVPVDRRGGSGVGKGGSHLDKLLDDGWNLLLYPEGTRSRGDGLGRVRRGAAVLAASHNIKIVPIRVSGTAEAMPPGQSWPKRIRGTVFSRRHKIEVTFGEPISPDGDASLMIDRVQEFFESGETSEAAKSLYRRRGSREE